MGDALAEEVRKVLLEKNITVDVVIPVSLLTCPPSRHMTVVNDRCQIHRVSLP